MTAVGFRDSAYVASATSTTSTSLTVPATVQAGDTMLLFTAAAAANINGPSGWTQQAIWNSGGIWYGTCWSQTATAASAGSTLTTTFNIATYSVTALLAFTGVVSISGNSAGSSSNLTNTPVNVALSAPNGAALAYFGSWRYNPATGCTMSRGTLDGSGNTGASYAGATLGHELPTTSAAVTQTYAVTSSQGYPAIFNVLLVGSDPTPGGVPPQQPVAATYPASSGFLYKGRSTKTADTGSVP